MTYEELIAYYGTQQNVSARLKVGQTTVSYWKKAGIPLDAQVAAEVDSEGEIKADLPEQVREARA